MPFFIKPSSRRAYQLELKQSQNLATVRRLLDEYEARGETVSSNELYNAIKGPWPNTVGGNPELDERYYRLYGQVVARESYAYNLAQAKEQLSRLKTMAAPMDRVGSLVRLLEIRYTPHERVRLEQELGVSWDQFRLEFESILVEHYTDLVNRAELEKEAYLELKNLLKWVEPRGKLSRHITLERPRAWNDWTAKHLRVPHLDDFHGLKSSDLPTGEVRLQAAEALRTSDLAKAQFVLACCNADPKRLKELGSVLVAELAKFVERERAISAVSLDKTPPQ